MLFLTCWSYFLSLDTRNVWTQKMVRKGSVFALILKAPMEMPLSLQKYRLTCPRESLFTVSSFYRMMYRVLYCGQERDGYKNLMQNLFHVFTVLVQDKANGRVQTIVDNRAALTAARLAGGNKDSMAAMSQLLGGGKRN